MKANIKDKKLGFQPVAIEITFESLDELLEFYGRMNMSTDHVHKFGRVPSVCGYDPGKSNLIDLFFIAKELIAKNT